MSFSEFFKMRGGFGLKKIVNNFCEPFAALMLGNKSRALKFISQTFLDIGNTNRIGEITKHRFIIGRVSDKHRRMLGYFFAHPKLGFKKQNTCCQFAVSPKPAIYMNGTNFRCCTI